MAITQNEVQSIINAVLSAIRTNSRTIGQLTPVTSLSDNDSFEIDGGKRVTYAVLKKLIEILVATKLDSLNELISSCQIKSVDFNVTENTAFLTIRSNESEISCNAPIATSTQAGFITALDKNNIQTAKQTADAAQTTANTAKQTADTAKQTADTAKQTADTAKTSAANTAESLKKLTENAGAAGGMALLGPDAKIPADNLPVPYTVEFNARVKGITVQESESDKAATDDGCMLVYDTESGKFLLAVNTRTLSPSENWDAVLRPKTETETLSPQAELSGISDFWEVDDGNFTLNISAFRYYAKWADAHRYGEISDSGVIPLAGRIYTCTSDSHIYRWSGDKLEQVGLATGETSGTAYPGEKGAKLRKDADILKSRADGVRILPFDGIRISRPNIITPPPKSGVWWEASEDGGAFIFVSSDFGFTEDEYNLDGFGRTDRIFRNKTSLYRVVDGELKELGSASEGNCLNVTVELPKKDTTTDPYHDLESAIARIYEERRTKLGLQITFATTATTWKQYQYIGSTLGEDDFLNIGNWIDMAGMSAGSETLININNLCGDKDYTLSTAVQALIDHEKGTKTDYRKEGLVITYRRDAASNTWETKQYHGLLTDMTPTNEAQWKDFGGGGGISETASEVEKDNTKPVTSGGVFDALQTKPIVNFDDLSDAENYVFQGVNEKGEAVGDPISVPRSNGSGQQGGSTLNIYPESQAVWGAFGSPIVLSAAIKSVSYDGDTEILGTIKTVSILDALTRIVLWNETVNAASSTSAADMKFNFDFTDFLSTASSKDFIIRATDADGNTKSRTITVTAVDVTCTCIQTLNHSATTSLEAGGREKSLPMYKFGNNVSTRQGILVKTEIFYNGAWRTLGTATVVDSYSHSISVNPCNLFGGGERMAHGAYPLRIQGTDIASGVEGNTIHTAVMCVDAENPTPIVALRYDDRNSGKIRLYDSVSVDVAAYTPGKTATAVEVLIDGHIATSVNCDSGQTLNVRKQIQGYASDGSKTIEIMARSGSSETTRITLTVEGSAIDASIKEGAEFAFDFSTRSNNESDHTIADGGYEMAVDGCNWNSNGFVQVLGETALRIAENVKAEIPYAPFGSSALETSGAALQLAFSTKSIKDKDAKLCECYDPAAGVGFYIRGNEIVLSVLDGTPQRQRVGFRCGEKVTVAVVVEPGSKYVTYKPSGSASGTDYAFVKLYVNGEECAAIGYQPGTNALRQNKTITFNSENGDFNLYYFMAYSSYMEWLQAFRNYLCKLSDVSAMIAEYDKENVLDTTGKPSMSLMAAKGIPYYVVVADQTTFNNFDYALNGGTSTSDQFACTLYYFNPQHPELNFKAVNVLWRRQGTTSAQRPIKNDRFNFNKKNKTTGLKATVTLLNPDDSTELGKRAIAAARHNKVLVDPDGFAVDIITVKVDFSDSSNANDCGVCDMMNATFRALGPAYQTPAQRAFDGTQDLGDGDILTGRHLDHSTKNHPIACFRATTDTLQDAWFHAKGNWKEDKGEQTALGFKDTPGYNKGCLNYGDFIEFFGTPDETLAQTEARFRTSEGLDSGNIYLISQYCGRDYAIYRFKDGAWKRSTGSMKQVNGKWVVTGDVLNPVTGYELLQYAGMDWFQGVATVEDMMKPSTQVSSWVRKLGLAATEYPAWTYYFECMVDDDRLQEDLALGKKVPYDLFNLLRFFGSCDYSKVSGWKKIWQENAYRYISLESAMAYAGFTDYLAAVDQRAKNMQPMFFLEDGCSVENGVYSGHRNMEPTRMYLNKVYDCDTCNGADNDGGRDIDAEVDPNKPTDVASGYTNPYMGSGSVLFNNMNEQQECWNSNDLGATTISLKSVISRMRNQTAEIDGKTMVPFSPAGALHFFVEKRLKFWPKAISSYDGERKYIDNTGIANLPYFYALHGLGLTSLPRFIEQRWAIRDGYYQTGDFFTNPLSGRVSAIAGNSRIHIKAAAAGYFGIGNDASGQLSETVFLEAGQSHTFTDFAHDAGALLYIYQPGRMSRIDLSEMSLAFHFNDLSKLELAEEIILGGSKHAMNTPLNGFNPLGSIVLGDMPFLRKLDISRTTATSLDAKGCPRIESILATDTALTTCSLAQTAPIDTLALPASMTSLRLVNLPKLSYPGGLTVDSMANIASLMVEGCPKVDIALMVNDAVSATSLSHIRLTHIDLTAPSSVLQKLRDAGTIGLSPDGEAYDETGQCSGITGRWIMEDYIPADVLDGYARYFPQLQIHNSQFSTVIFSDDESDSANVSNPENRTGFKYSTEDSLVPYVPCGNVARIRDTCPVCQAVYNPESASMTVRPLSADSLLKYVDGTAFDPTDSRGDGYDVMKYIRRYYYKGVNHFTASEKYLFVSSNEETPLSTASSVGRVKAADSILLLDSALLKNSQSEGAEPVISNYSTTSVCKVNVSGMKLLRYPGINAAQMAVVFTGADGKVISVFSFYNPLSDMQIGDYLIAEVPKDAVWALLTVPKNLNTEEIIMTDSDNIESVEPDWLVHEPELIGIYHGHCDGARNFRSISGVVTTHGDGTSTTNPDWEYDSYGNLTSIMVPMTEIHWTYKDFSNAAAVRGAGYQMQDYESWKDFSVMVMAITGTRDLQALCGMGFYNDGRVATGGYDTQNPQGFSAYPSAGGNPPKGNLLWGVQNYMACGYEWVDNVAINVESWTLFKRNRCVATSGDPIDHKWHIYNPSTGEERIVQGLNSGSGCCIGKMRWGKYCDIVCSQVTGDKTKWNQHYADKFEYVTSRGIVGERSYALGAAYGGLVSTLAINLSSHSTSSVGARLAFRGPIVVDDVE